jgi:DNA topoisomerase IB
MAIELLIDPEEAAEAAHLHYVNDDGPGYTRKWRGRGFAYFDAEGALITDPAETVGQYHNGLPQVLRSPGRAGSVPGWLSV